MGKVPNVRKCDMFIKVVQPPLDKQEKLKIKECALFVTGLVLISAIGITVTS
jgi:hypothetical protein